MSVCRAGFFFALILSGTAFASTGQIKIEVNDAPGEINLDGMPTDQTAPATIDSVSPGEHLVELQYACLQGSERVTVRANEVTTVDLRMRNVGGSGTVRLRGLPPLAKVFVDEKPVSQAANGILLPCGGHRIHVEAEGFADWEEMVVVTTDRWTTSTVHLVEVAIESSRSSERSLREDLDDLDDLEDDLLSRDQSFRERGDRQSREQQERLRAEREAEEARRQQAIAEAARRKAETRRSRYGDVDSLDEEGPVEDNADQDDFDREDLDQDEGFGEDSLRIGSNKTEEISEETGSRKGAVLALSTAGTGVATLVYGLILQGQYKSHLDQWDFVATSSSGPNSPEAVSYWNSLVGPAKFKRNVVLGVGSALLLSGGGASVYVYMAVPGEPEEDEGSSRPRIDDLDDLDLLVPRRLFQIRYTGKW